MALEFNVWLAGQMYRQRLSTVEVAADLGLQSWVVYAWLTGDGRPVGGTLRRLCEYLEVRPSLIAAIFE